MPGRTPRPRLRMDRRCSIMTHGLCAPAPTLSSLITMALRRRSHLISRSTADSLLIVSAPWSSVCLVYDPSLSEQRTDRPVTHLPGSHNSIGSIGCLIITLAFGLQVPTGPMAIAEKMNSWSRWTSHSPQSGFSGSRV